nr:unnamed protein product [Digitaria exilis]
MGKKQKKPGKGKEKTERKTAKGEEKRARREARKVGEEDDIDAILRSIQKEEAKKKEVHVEENVPAPSPRSNCSLTINPLKETELILYGGEFYNGSKTFVYGDLYRYDVEKNEWKLVLYKHKIVLFGGFYDTLREVSCLHATTNTHPPNPLAIMAEPTIAELKELLSTVVAKLTTVEGEISSLKVDQARLHVAVNNVQSSRLDTSETSAAGGSFYLQIYLYGGYFKEVASDKEKGTVHADMWSLDPRTWEWNKVKKAGMPPGPRAGFSMCVHKKRAVLFGGVVDMEVEGFLPNVQNILWTVAKEANLWCDVIMSMFMNELYGFQLDNHRWYPLELRKDKPAKNKTKDIKRKESTNDVEANIDNDGDEVMEDFDAIEGQPEVHGVSNQLTKSLSITRAGSSKSSDVLSDSAAQEAPPEAVKPSGRINACMAVGKDMLYLYGGMMEVKDREITLDDLFSLNLSKLDEWKCIIPASESEWLEISEDEDDDDDDEAEENENDSEEDASQTDEDEESDEDAARNVSSAVSLLKGESKTMRRKEKRARIEQIRVILGLSDSQRTPVPGETLRDFYKRTNMYWQMAAYEHTQHTGKELRKDGFDLAETRYKELKPILDELAVLEAEQKAEEEASGSTSSKRDTKKGKQKSAGR